MTQDQIQAMIDEIEQLRDALQFIADGYDNQDVNHVDYRVKVYQVATEALALSSQDHHTQGE